MHSGEQMQDHGARSDHKVLVLVLHGRVLSPLVGTYVELNVTN